MDIGKNPDLDIARKSRFVRYNLDIEIILFSNYL